MSAAPAFAAERVWEADRQLARLRSRVDVRALIARGWDPGRRVFEPAADDPLFGYHLCERVRCPRAGESDRARALGLCEPCTKRYLELSRRLGDPISLEQFKARPLCRHAQAEREQTLCLVCRTPRHERPAVLDGLCASCSRLARDRGQSPAAHAAGDERWPP